MRSVSCGDISLSLSFAPFKNTHSSYEQDIDVIIARGEQRTADLDKVNACVCVVCVCVCFLIAEKIDYFSWCIFLVLVR